MAERKDFATERKEADWTTLARDGISGLGAKAAVRLQEAQLQARESRRSRTPDGRRVSLYEGCRRVPPTLSRTANFSPSSVRASRSNQGLATLLSCRLARLPWS